MNARTKADNDGYTFERAPTSIFDFIEELYNDFGLDAADLADYCENGDVAIAVLAILVISSVGFFSSGTSPGHVVGFIAGDSFFIISVKLDLT